MYYNTLYWNVFNSKICVHVTVNTWYSSVRCASSKSSVWCARCTCDVQLVLIEYQVLLYQV